MRRVQVRRIGGYQDAQTLAPGAAGYARTVKKYALPDPPGSAPLGRPVVLWLVREVDGARVRRTVSDPITGDYAFLPADPRYTYSVVAVDPTGEYVAQIADSQRVGV